MSKETFYNEILSDLYTKEQASFLQLKIDSLLESIFITDKTIEEKIDSHLSPNQKRKLIAAAKKINLDLNDPIAFQKFLLKIKKAIQDLPVENLFVSYNLSSKTIEKIVNWFQENLGFKTLIEIHVDSSLVGGLIINRNGRFYDYSLKNLLYQAREDGFFKPSRLLT